MIAIGYGNKCFLFVGVPPDRWLAHATSRLSTGDARLDLILLLFPIDDSRLDELFKSLSLLLPSFDLS